LELAHRPPVIVLSGQSSRYPAAMPQDGLALPPRDLAARVGVPQEVDPLDFYLNEGRRLRGVIERLLPAGWDWQGKRALDFGCGAARVLRHFEPEAHIAELYGCDIDRTSVEWDLANLSPPFRFFHSGLEPPLDLADGSLDLVWAMSVFTHIGDSWSAWLAELHRVLDAGGIVIASFLGGPMWEALLHRPYAEDEVGMAVAHGWEGPDAWVFHSEWWLREHWGRAFDVLAVEHPPRGPDGALQITHGYIALRRREVVISPAELERIDRAEPRELAALQTEVRLLRDELTAMAETATAAARPPRPGWREAVPEPVRRLGRRLLPPA
jgi:SAM-dependent methyltransferase